MMELKTDDLTTYIESLCKSHTSICHSQSNPHFVGPDNNEQIDGIRNKFCYPLVIMDRLSTGYSLTADAQRKTFHIELLFLDNPKKDANNEDIQFVWESMTGIAEDFLKKIVKDIPLRKPDILKTASLSGAEIQVISNIHNFLYGVSLSVDIDTIFSMCIENGRFTDVLLSD